MSAHDRQVIGDALRTPDGTVIPLSKAIRAGDYIFVSGQLPFGKDGRVVDGGIDEQTRQTLENIASVLEEAGSSLADIVKCSVWLTDKNDFRAFNKAYATHFPDSPPARSTVRSDLMVDARIEIDAIAYAPARA